MKNDPFESAVAAVRERDRWTARLSRIDDSVLRQNAMSQIRYYEEFLRDLKRALHPPSESWFGAFLRMWRETE